MNAYIIFHSKYSKPKASVSQTMSRDAQRAAKCLRALEAELQGQRGLQPPPPPTQPSHLKKLTLKCKSEVFKRVFELTCG